MASSTNSSETIKNENAILKVDQFNEHQFNERKLLTYMDFSMMNLLLVEKDI